ncbi:MAG: bifunctional 4-hydroxy-2-oxoglutarate aldolase/2-dehydro-3-deoxy-phosphogluconate aldolase [Pirellulaceae bacterium]|nr:bifunctional 4-hydroxy-2-oxoglutarate aldolase/2-dehydro-3-deoxy-phosphogluconate aldolase [Pirellulaceae bacterium]MDG2105524.1 bifunctional 4-hydroxy-2-oxoglutarate aldolase/2-dehydro-3-deoxy-phosphogluconate aldolase [Pirellulaceae bacterium]
MSEVHDSLIRYQIIPVVRIDTTAAANPLFDALERGGLPVAEITLRTPCALEAIQLAAKRQQFMVGAGTVLNTSDCQAALNAGAQFIVSPGLDEAVVNLCKQHGIPCYPGVATPSEIQKASNMGVRTVKFFPAEPLGGVNMLAALAAPFHQMKFIPTGGINASNVASYLALDYVDAIGGSWMVKPKLYADGNFSDVTQLTRQAMTLVGYESSPD